MTQLFIVVLSLIVGAVVGALATFFWFVADLKVENEELRKWNKSLWEKNIRR